MYLVRGGTDWGRLAQFSQILPDDDVYVQLLIYLGRYPEKRWQQVLWMLLLIGVNKLLEWIGLHKHVITRLHHTRPLIAWVATALVFLFFIWHFHIPIRGLK